MASDTTRLQYQAQFQQRWPHLQHPHVRSLAWLLDSPALLNGLHPRWTDQLAQLQPPDQVTTRWLLALDQAPQPLVDFLALHPHTRLGHYAEKLLAFYFQSRGELFAHGVQVRSHITIGEFDFLLDLPDGFEHWEFACKFYLLVEPGKQLSDFVGPNLADNLCDKSRKIMDAQLALGLHEDAQKYLPRPLHAARALLKGWLFYPDSDSDTLAEIEPDHCRGVWRRLSELNKTDGERFTVLPRLSWLAPARVSIAETAAGVELRQNLTHQFERDRRPVLVAVLTECAGWWIETERMFVVPDDWNRVTPALF